MKRDDAKKLSDVALEELAAQLAAGKSEELTKFLNTMSSFHNYSFGNCLLIVQQMPTATRVAGFRAWQKLNRQVRQGEKGICILAPLIGKKKAEDGSSEAELLGFRGVTVFDVSQTDGEDLPDIHRIEGDPGEKLSRLHATAISLGITLSYEEDLGGADGVSQGGSIVLRSGLTSAAEFNTLAHELAHELLHRGEDRKTLSKTVKELEAESVAYVVSTAVGLRALAQSADYIHCHAGDSEQLAKSLQRIQKTASLLLEQLETVSLDSISEVA
ncbi:ArdC-like ssDNA-binding domain-containing protein [Bythopirellula goksoeyrii]|uniref:N-terminal domain-containing protein n=1 Tax=Bythopirellula goksoeyrii TaxID=1400387 RepID=A0A5B9QF44_9BACT|nr:ArdC-like ssDNA-binding domain-containing protein [Bythopirellula goksoeyrii]QEG36142.1 hypothetical protein Pr1d_34510 [Bythopirellula goksoeyrii]